MPLPSAAAANGSTTPVGLPPGRRRRTIRKESADVPFRKTNPPANSSDAATPLSISQSQLLQRTRTPPLPPPPPSVTSIAVAAAAAAAAATTTATAAVVEPRTPPGPPPPLPFPVVVSALAPAAPLPPSVPAASTSVSGSGAATSKQRGTTPQPNQSVPRKSWTTMKSHFTSGEGESEEAADLKRIFTRPVTPPISTCFPQELAERTSKLLVGFTSRFTGFYNPYYCAGDQWVKHSSNLATMNTPVFSNALRMEPELATAKPPTTFIPTAVPIPLGPQNKNSSSSSSSSSSSDPPPKTRKELPVPHSAPPTRHILRQSHQPPPRVSAKVNIYSAGIDATLTPEDEEMGDVYHKKKSADMKYLREISYYRRSAFPAAERHTFFKFRAARDNNPKA